jgi:alkylated DNA repair protein (DNA oxidative demethylase)
MLTPGGKPMSVGITNCGTIGWITDRRGYRYSPADPQTGTPWPPMPEIFAALATSAAQAAGYAGFTPDSCLINRYAPGAKMALHQDRDEQDLTAPIVSVSLGLPAIFLWGGPARTDKPTRHPLVSDDVLVFGGPGRLNFHGVLPIKEGIDPVFGRCRINLTFRKAR